MSSTYSSYTKARMQRLFDTCIITDNRYTDIDRHIRQIVKGKDRYFEVSIPFHIPWYVTGIVHKTICDCDFKTHLCNGDSLIGRTLNVPAGYPKKGRPPFTWEQSVLDMFAYYRWDKWTDWSISGILFNLDTVCRSELTEKDTSASRLWCFSNHYVSQEKEDRQQCGGAVLLRRMAEKKLFVSEINYERRLNDIKSLGAEIAFMPNRISPKAVELQKLMNISGACLREDGRIGRFSAYAYHQMTKEYLNGDPEAHA